MIPLDQLGPRYYIAAGLVIATGLLTPAWLPILLRIGGYQ